jgi:hypothetical protein
MMVPMAMRAESDIPRHADRGAPVSSLDLRKYWVLIGLVVGLLSALTAHICSVDAVRSSLQPDSWHLQAALDAAAAVTGFCLGGAAAGHQGVRT